MSESTPHLSTNFAEPLERFYEYLRSEKGLNLYTQRNYKQQLESMGLYLMSVGVDGWVNVDAGWVRQLASKGMRSGMKESSIATRLSSLRSFFDFLILRGEMNAILLKGVCTKEKASFAEKP